MGTAPDTIKRLIDRFSQQSDQIRSPDYNETLIRIDFINPLMSELGWDIDNRQGFAEQYREVVHEDRVKVAGQTKAPDYSFRVGGVRKFFLEAKKPAVNIRNNWEPAYQLRRYAWSARLACSLLTDFEEFAIYDTRVRPREMEKASVGRREFIKYTDYPDRWDFLVGTFSKDAVLRGEFDRYCESKKGRGAEPFDEAFLGEIEEWRKLLASSLARHNAALDDAALNFAVQRIIDRIIFLRIAEDRGTETVGQLQALLSGDNVYKRLVTLFNRADERYNSGLFHFAKEKERDEAPDTLTPTLSVDDKSLKTIIKALYYPQSPYEFTMVSADILGSIYERFLGKVITLTAGHNAKIEEKPEVRKAGGVYYTPTYIVDYIVKNTVGKLLDGKSPKEAKIKVLDPACGSGSFLIGAYQFLLDWYLQQYTTNAPAALATGKRPVLRPAPDGGWKLTIAERKRILLDHIHGVDLDAQAVEVTKLNLLLKCLEGETSQSLGFEQRLFRERALPDLGKNILCGNSLIGTDIIGTDAWNKMTEEERAKINPFDYERAFPKVFRRSPSPGTPGEGRGEGGFDAVIGNPPYIRIQGMTDVSPQSVEYLTANFRAAASGNYDIYVVFIERGLSLLAPLGSLGYIVPHKFFNAAYGEALREHIASGRHLRSLVHFGHEQVFADATTYTCLLFLAKRAQESTDVQLVPSLESWRATGNCSATTIPTKDLGAKAWTFSAKGVGALMSKLAAAGQALGTIAARIAQGIRTSANEVFVLDVVDATANPLVLHSEALNSEVRIEAAAVHGFLGGRDIKRWAALPSHKVAVIPYELRDGRARLIPPGRFEAEFPLGWKYLQKNRDALAARESGKMAGENWYGFVYPKNLEIMLSPKILIPDIADRAQFTIDGTGKFAFSSGYALTLPADATLSFAELLALLNSRVLSFFVRQVSTPMRGGFFRFFTQFLEQVPIVDISGASRLAIGRYADTMLSLHKRLAAEQHPQRREQIQREIEATDRQIDQLVYQLYGLTDDEIRIVEEATR